MKPLSNPILLIGDNPALHGGLSRIGRDLAMLLCTMGEFRVGYLARSCGNNRRFPFITYDFHESEGWGQRQIESTWSDFSNGENGIILTTDDMSRRGWFANPPMYGNLGNFLGEGRTFQKWGYTPVDSYGPNSHSLGVETAATSRGYDRIMAASEWGCQVLRNSGNPNADWLPHGIDMRMFAPDMKAGKKLGADPNTICVGAVMANQSRKDFPVAFETAALLKKHYGNRFRFWLHTDVLIRHWNVYALAADYGVGDCLEVTQQCNDEELALRYSACDCTILPSGGEGFGYPIAESLACGTACVVTDYAAGQELVPEECRVKPVAMRLDTPFNVQRAVLSGYGFANAAIAQIEKKRADAEYRSEEMRNGVIHLDWQRLKYPWMAWFRAGLHG